MQFPGLCIKMGTMIHTIIGEYCIVTLIKTNSVGVVHSQEQNMFH